jgi:YVTN family beta-propeller protein
VDELKLSQSELPTLPTGTVTFLFTDIEGSTDLVRRLGDDWAEVREQHRRLLRAEFERHRGIELGTEGDSFFLAFSRATDAVSAAIAGQIALARNEWPDEAPIRVRMGLHTGEVQYSDEGGYTGLPVHEAARVANAAHGGQVLISQIVRDLTTSRLREPTALRDLGMHRLKDISEPQRIYQVVHPDIASDFPPIRTIESFRAARVQKGRFTTTQIVAAAAVVVVAAIAVVLATRGGDAALQANSVGVFTDGGDLEQVIPVGANPADIAAGEGRVWVTNLDDKTISSINASDYSVARTPSAVGTPTDVGVGEGAVWVANGFEGKLQRIDPSTGQVVKSISVATGTHRLAVGEGGVWLASNAAEKLTLIDPELDAPDHDVDLPGPPSDVAAGDGAVWVADGLGGKLYRVDPATDDVSTIAIQDHPRKVVVESGQVWTINSDDDTVSHIDTDTNQVATIDVGNEPTGLAVADDAVWVTNRLGDSLLEIDPDRNVVVERFSLDFPPSGIAVIDGRLWVAITEPSSG